MNATTINFTIAATAPAESAINFKVLTDAYHDPRFTYDVQEIFANICRYLYWNAVRQAQRLGVTPTTLSFIERNRNAYLERPEYTENRVQSSLSKVIRHSCRLNTALKNKGYPWLLLRYYNKDENGWYSMSEAQNLALDIAHAYREKVGKDIMETRWDLKL